MLLRSKLIIFLTLLLTVSLLPQQELQEGINYFTAKEWQKAISFFSTVLKRNPASMLSYHYLGAAYLESGRGGDAYTILKDGVARFPYEKAIVGNYLNAGLLTGRTDDPLRAGLAYLKKNPADQVVKNAVASAYSRQAEQLLSGGKYSAAQSAARSALRYNSADENAYSVIIRSFLLDGKTKESLREAESAVKSFPGSIPIQTAYLAALNASQEFEKALNLALKLNKYYRDDIDFQMQLGFLYRANYKIQDGSSVFERLINKYPSQERIYDGAITYFESLNQYDKVRTLYEAKIKIFGKERDFRIKIAESYEDEKLPQSARSVYLNLLQRGNDNDVRMLLANSYLENDLQDSALSELRLVLEYDSSEYDANKLLCSTLSSAKSQSEFMSAAEAFRAAHPKDFYSNYYLSLAWQNNGNLKMSREYAEAAHKIDHDKSLPFSILAAVSAAASDQEGAKFYAKQSVLKALAEIKELENVINKLLSDASVENAHSKKRQAASLKKDLNELQSVLDKNFQLLGKISSTEELRNTLNSILLKFPKNPLVQKEKGDFHKGRSENDSAVYFYKQALNGNPNLAECHSSLAQIYAGKGNYNDAIQSLLRTVSAEPGNIKAYDYIIEYALKNGTAKVLADNWIKVYKTDKSNTLLRERLIEVLHKTDRFDDAKKIIQDIKE